MFDILYNCFDGVVLASKNHEMRNHGKTASRYWKVFFDNTLGLRSQKWWVWKHNQCWDLKKNHCRSVFIPDEVESPVIMDLALILGPSQEEVIVSEDCFQGPTIWNSDCLQRRGTFIQDIDVFRYSFYCFPQKHFYRSLDTIETGTSHRSSDLENV